MQKKTIIFAVLYSLFVIMGFQKDNFANGIYTIGAVIISYLFILGACAHEFKNNSEVLLNSLPIKRSVIVKARYFSAFVFMFFALIVSGITGALLKASGFPFPKYYLKIEDIVGTMISLILMISLYFPIYFKYGYLKSRIINFIMFFSFFLIPNLLISFLKDIYSKEQVSQLILFLNSYPNWVIVVVLAGAACILMAISYFISVWVYSKREF